MDTCKENMRAYALGSIIDGDTGEPIAERSEAEAIATFAEAFRNEFDTPHARLFWPSLTDRVEEFIKGLPSCLSIAFDDATIEREILPPLGFPENECAASTYWHELAAALVALMSESDTLRTNATNITNGDNNANNDNMEKRIYYTRDEAQAAAEAFIQENGGRIDRQTATIDHKARGLEESDSFTANVSSWSGEASAVRVEDSHGQTAALFGYWTTESKAYADALARSRNAVAAWNSDAFCVEGESAEGVAAFMARKDVEEWTYKPGELEPEDWATLAAWLDLEPEDPAAIHQFVARDGERLTICFRGEF